MKRMNAGWCVLFSILVGGAVPLYAQDAKGGSPAAQATERSVKPEVNARAVREDVTVSLSFNETPLTDVIKAFRETTGANIVSGGTNLNAMTVSMRLDRVPWRQGLESVLEPQGLQALEQPLGSGIYVIKAKTSEVPLCTRAFSLVHIRAEEVALLFKSTFGLRMEVMSSGARTIASTANIKYNVEAKTVKDLEDLFIKQNTSKMGSVTPYSVANVVVVTATEKELTECAKILEAIDKPRPQVYIEARFMELSASASRELGLKWNQLGGEGWGATVDGVGAGLSDQKTTTDSRGQYIDKSIREQNTTVTYTLDANGNTVPVETTTWNTFAPSGTVLADNMTHVKSKILAGQIAADRFRLTMNAFEQMDGVSVFSNPKVIVANEEKAVVDMTIKYPYIEMSYQAATTQNGKDSVTTKISPIPGTLFKGDSFFSYGIALDVTPRVSPTGLITVDIEPSISERQGDTTIMGVDSKTPMVTYPVISMRRLKTVFTMNDGYTAVIGGLTRSTENSVDSGIPYLRKIPWIGDYLFGWKKRMKEQKEIVIFVTVGIANPMNMKEDVGLPKNAVLGREFVARERKEPGDQTKTEFLALDLNPVEKPAKKNGTSAESPKVQESKGETGKQPAATPAQ